jgi:hypothetical protein
MKKRFGSTKSLYNQELRREAIQLSEARTREDAQHMGGVAWNGGTIPGDYFRTRGNSIRISEEIF